MKRCIGCGKDAPNSREFFSPKPGAPGGLNPRCKPCANAKLVEWRRPRRKRPDFEDRPGFQNCRACYKEFPLTSDFFIRSVTRPNGFASRCRPCRAAAVRDSYRRNPLKAMQYSHQRRAREANAGGKLTATDIERKFKSQAGKCHWCGKELKLGNWQVDHLIPLARGGNNSPENVVCACQPCNQSKCAKLPHEWIGRLL